MKRPTLRVEPLLLASYIAMVKGSVGTRMFQTVMARVNGQKRDILRQGTLSCGYFTSAVLLLFGLIKEIHTTVAGTLRDMQGSGWRRIRKPRIGCIILWEPIRYADGAMHAHLGFFLGGAKAVSTSSSRRTPILHHWTYGRRSGRPVRKIEAFFWHPKLHQGA